MDQVETVTLEAGTVLHYRGMPLELREAAVVNMRHGNHQLALSQFDALVRTPDQAIVSPLTSTTNSAED